MNWRKLLVVIGIIWLALVVCFNLWHLFSICPVIKCAGECSGCATYDLVSAVIVFGIPSWILFLIAALTKSKKKRKK